MFDKDTSINSQKQVSRRVFFHLHNTMKINTSCLEKVAEKLVHAFVTSRLNYCNLGM